MTDNITLEQLQRDLEWSCTLNRSVGDGARFSLLLSMLQQNVMERPALTPQTPETLSLPLPENPYRRAPLSASEDTAIHLSNAAQLAQQSAADARLYLSMHPEPLSLYNDAKRISDEVRVNCDWYTQQRLAGEAPAHTIEEDATQLHDILQQLEAEMAAA
ncbi:hypothetical protein LJ739_04260 [Aestuariibacter halophilus]|uniref:Uncharacterized protein n=1 Tax=Fluctibacter halophilus TaxID=226011 RepID=A0ABS8G899_9ALTE|nr:VC2046/SO_2500 family protein [Aestuariibacter halophilus]MCC2615451.1 hypothetical protein [Aestuariibacter halophilus]